MPQNDELARNPIGPALDVLGTGRFGSMSWLIEIYLSEQEQELARLSVEWQLNSKNTLSVGKFHNLQGYIMSAPCSLGPCAAAAARRASIRKRRWSTPRLPTGGVTYMWSDRGVAWTNLRIVAELWQGN